VPGLFRVCSASVPAVFRVCFGFISGLFRVGVSERMGTMGTMGDIGAMEILWNWMRARGFGRSDFGRPKDAVLGSVVFGFAFHMSVLLNWLWKRLEVTPPSLKLRRAGAPCAF
jgi:hypothetical protein